MEGTVLRSCFMFGIWREKIPSMEGNGRTMETKQGASEEGDEWWLWGIRPRGGYRVGVQAIKEPTSTAGPLDPHPNCQKNLAFWENDMNVELFCCG